MADGVISRLQALIAQLQGALQGERRVRGTVSGATGATIAGSGWSATRTGTGSYTVSFSAAFGGVPSVVVSSAQNTVGAAYDVEAVSATATGFTVTTREPGVAFVDCSFCFIAVGP